MILKEKSFLRTLLASVIFTFAFFISGHLTYLFEGDFISYLHLYCEKIWDFVFPLGAAFATLFITSKRKFGSLFLLPVLYSLTAIIYYLPMRYEHLVLNERYISLEALILALAYSVIMLLEVYLRIIAIAFITYLFSRLFYRRERSEMFVTGESASIFDLDTPRVGAALIASLLVFLFSLLREIIYTATTLPSIIDTITLPEIITMAANYLILILLLVASHAALVRFSTIPQKNI